MRRTTATTLAALSVSSLLVLSAPAEDKPALTLESDAFREGQMIPATNTCDGDDISPALHWAGAPAQTRALALVVDDPDAPGGNWNHWVLFNIPAATRALAPAVTLESSLGDGTKQGTNDFGKIGYGGPCPPEGSTHRYEFKLYALSAPLELKPGAKRDAVLEAIEDVTIAKTKLVGRYRRQPKAR